MASIREDPEQRESLNWPRSPRKARRKGPSQRRTRIRSVRPFSDCDRIIHCKARLTAEAQDAGVLRRGHHYRTRLTHTLEVGTPGDAQGAGGCIEGSTEAIALGTIRVRHGHGRTRHPRAGARRSVTRTEPGIVDARERAYRALLTWEVRDGIARHPKEARNRGAPPEYREHGRGTNCAPTSSPTSITPSTMRCARRCAKNS
jgi:hypothetical protein